MTRQEVNEERIAAATNSLRTANNNINNEFNTMRNKMLQLESNWRGAAGTAAHTTMHQLLNRNKDRSTVIENYINILERQINPRYVSTESTNVSLADKFK
jgi:uncharacterized protein YukE